MKPFSWLILTDHRGHSDQNSVYALTRTLCQDSRSVTVFVASRGDQRNAAFFAGDLEQPLYGLRATEKFTFDPDQQQFQRAATTMHLPEADVLWLRLPPPADPAFFAQLTAATSGRSAGPVIINAPRGIMETGSKAFLSHFPDYTPALWPVHSPEEVRKLARLYPIVLKPLREYGGRGLVRVMKGIAESSDERQLLGEWLAGNAAALRAGDYLAMEYLHNVSQGDKRILVVNGKILGASLRIPASGQWLCNVSRGGTSVLAEVSPEEEAMVAAVAPVLLQRGVVIFGADTLVDDSGKRVLSELNTNSIGGFPQAEAQTGRPVLQQTINGLYDYLDTRL